MDKRAEDAFKEWKSADAKARVAEQRLNEAWDDYSALRAGPPAEELIHEVSRCRAHANEKLTAAIAAVGSSAAERPARRERPGREH